MRLSEIEAGSEGVIASVAGTDKIRRFLYAIGCYPGERITLVSILAGNYVVRIKDSRFAVDRKMAQIIELSEVRQLAAEHQTDCGQRSSRAQH